MKAYLDYIGCIVHEARMEREMKQYHADRDRLIPTSMSFPEYAATYLSWTFLVSAGEEITEDEAAYLPISFRF